MGRNRVLSFMSTWSATLRDNKSPTPPTSPSHDNTHFPRKPELGEPFQPPSGLTNTAPRHPAPIDISAPPSPRDAEHAHSNITQSPTAASPHGRQRSNSRPLSISYGYTPPVMDINEDTIPELQPIFTFLNSHGNKLYQEGYFLKLDDQNSQGRPNADRTWTECFAQLVGTVLSLWDAAELDAAGENGEVLPKFINLTDASIKMIESLPTKSNDEQPLQNILSISTAGRNRYLLHFNSHHSLIQWTAGIRLAMFEQSTLQEAYTGALIAGKGKQLNNINLIMDRTRVRTEEWVRVRFGAGVPWRRCWCVISPPDEKEYQKLQKDLKKRSAYDRSHVPILKGDIKFYDTKKDGKKLKKAKPIATIEEAYSAYAIYPQSKALIDASTLIKIEGNITIHSDPPSSTEGFVFIMPEVPPAVTGFEMLLRFLFPTWDVFGLYGRPGRLVASVLDPRSLMFGMPKHRRYGYLEILDVTSIILADGSSGWSEREWRRKLKELTGSRMTAMDESGEIGVRSHSRSASRGSKRLSIGPGANPMPARPRVNFADDNAGSVRNSRSMSLTRPGGRTDSAPPADRLRAPESGPNVSGHARNASDTRVDGPLPMARDGPEMVEPPYRRHSPPNRGPISELAPTPERHSSEEETPPRDFEAFQRMHTPEPVQPPPTFAHGPSSKPKGRPYHSPELRRANSRLSTTTLAQLAKASGVSPGFDPDEQARLHDMGAGPGPVVNHHQDPRGPHAVQHPQNANPPGMTANPGSREVLNAPPHNPTPTRQSPGMPPQPIGQQQFKSPPAAAGPPGSSFPNPQYAAAPQTGTHDMSGGPGPAIHHNDPNRPPMQAHDPRRGPSPIPGGQPHTMNVTHRGPPPPQQQGGPPARGPPPRGPLPGTPGGPPGAYPQQAGRGRGMPPNAQPHGPPHGHPQGPPQQGPPSYGRRTPPPGAGRGGMPMNLQVSPPRKPLPARTTSLASRPDDGPPSGSSSLRHQAAGSGTSQSSISSRNNSLRDLVIDEAAFAQIGVESRPSPAPEQQVQRQQTQRSMASSNYDDASSTTSPDYASTRKSSETQESVDRPRAGVLRTVGEAQPPMPNKPDEYNVPSFNFGPTINYGAGNVPRNKTPTPFSGPSDSRTPPRSMSPGPSRAYSPGPGNSYFSAPRPRKSPAVSPGEQTRPTEVAHNRQESNESTRRSVAWQPGAVSVGGASGERVGAVTPEQFVQQRAASGSNSPFYHQRNPSSNTLAAMRGNTPTPTLLRRTSSYDMLNKVGGHSRSSSADLLSQQRSSSQGAAGALALGGGDGSSHLSAREQEHLARVTGTPLISMAGGGRNSPQAGAGLVGAIAAREHERQQAKDGLRSQTLQNAINSRQMQQEDQYWQQQQQLQQLQAQQQQQYLQQQQMQQQQHYMQSQGARSMGAPSVFGGSMGMQSHMSMMGGDGGYQLPPGHGPPQQQGFNSPSAGAYAQSAAGWNPGPRHGVAQQVDAPFIPSPQQGFVPGHYNQSSSPSQAQQPPRPNTPGSMGGGAAYRGQAF